MLFGADATGAIGSTLSSSASLRLSDFPAEHPSEKELADWVHETMPMLRRAGYGPILKKQVPPSLLHLQGSDIVPSGLTVEESTAAGAVEHAKHERIRQQLIRSNAQRKLQLTESLRGIRTQLHAMLEISMRERASLRLAELEKKHPEKDDAGTVIDDSYNGVDMLTELCSLTGSVGLLDDPRDHDREVEKMRDNVLPDGCMAQEYADRVNTLVKDHLDHLERPLAGANLGRFLILLMPAANAAEGRTILRELSASGHLSDRTVVLQRCMQVVRQSESATSKAAAAAAVVNRRQLMALGPAAPMAALAQHYQQLAKAMHAPPVAAAIAAGAAAGLVPGTPKVSKSQRRSARAAAAALAGHAPAAGAAPDTRGAPHQRTTSRLPDGKKCADGWCPYDHPASTCYRSPHIKAYPVHVESNLKQVARIEADRKRICEGATPPIPYRPVTLRTKPAAAAVGMLGSDAAGPAGEIGDEVPDGIARLMLVPASAAAPLSGGMPLDAITLRSMRASDPQCDSCDDDSDDEPAAAAAAPMSAGVPLTEASLAQMVSADPQCMSSGSSSDEGMPRLLDDSDATSSASSHAVAPPIAGAIPAVAAGTGVYPDLPAMPASPAAPMGTPVRMTAPRLRRGAVSRPEGQGD